MEYHFDQTNVNVVAESAVHYGVYPFEKEFAKRTLANLKYIENEIDRRHSQGISDQDIHDVFEVTQLINSFIGMLILPKEAFFRSMGNNVPFKSKKANDILMDLSRDPNKYHSTYKYTDRYGDEHKERLTPKNLARHFRNAVAHNHLSILPKDYTGDGIITGVEFSDNNSRGEDFTLELNIDEIRTLLLALCELILSYA